MFLKSKYEWNIDEINTYLLYRRPLKMHEKSIAFYMPNKPPTHWEYKTTKDRDNELSWILSQLDCRVNDGRNNIIDEAELHCKIQNGGMRPGIDK